LSWGHGLLGQMPQAMATCFLLMKLSEDVLLFLNVSVLHLNLNLEVHVGGWCR
jgi:hypothetical protein